MDTKASHEPRRADKLDRRPFRWRPREVFDILRSGAKEFVEDKAPKQSAALAYYTLFAIGPLLLLAIGIAALAFGSESVRTSITNEFSRLLGPAGGEGLTALLAGADREQVGLVGTIFGSIFLLVSAGAVFAQLKEAMNRIWEVQAKKAVGWKAKLWGALRKNFLSFAGVMGTGFLLLVSLVLSAGLAAMGDYFAEAFPGAELALQVANVVVSLAVITIVFAAVFKFLPDVRIAWRDVFVGAFVTAILFLVGQFAIGYYLGAGPLSTKYGAAGAMLVVLVWVYYSSMILFFGAELTQVFANRYGSHVRESRDARPLEEAIALEQAPPEEEGARRRTKGGQRRPQT